MCVAKSLKYIFYAILARLILQINMILAISCLIFWGGYISIHIVQVCYISIAWDMLSHILTKHKKVCIPRNVQYKAHQIQKLRIFFCLVPWWRHQMETFSALLALCADNPVNSPHKAQWRGALKLSLICAWISGWVNNREAGDLRWHRTHYNVIVV